jgi:hypothetical protein
MKTAAASALAIAVSITVCFASPQSPTALAPQAPDTKKPREKIYDGNWWLSVEPDERSGFLDGAGD